jgi:hypothetical protein
MTKPQHFTITHPLIHFLIFVFCGLALATFLSLFNNYLVFILISLIGSGVTWRLWETKNSAADSSRRIIESVQRKLEKTKINHKNDFNSLLKENGELKSHLNLTKIENDQLKNIPKTTPKLLDEELLNEAILYEIKSQNLEQELIRDRQTFKLRFNRLAKKVKQRTIEKNKYKLESLKLLEKLTDLELHSTKSVKSTCIRQNKLTRRPCDMWDVKFAEIAAIELDPFPENLIQEAKEHYNSSSSISLNATVDFLRHKFSNYEILCQELRDFNKEARHILKCRVNTEIWRNLANKYMKTSL